MRYFSKDYFYLTHDLFIERLLNINRIDLDTSPSRVRAIYFNIISLIFLFSEGKKGGRFPTKAIGIKIKRRGGSNIKSESGSLSTLFVRKYGFAIDVGSTC